MRLPAAKVLCQINALQVLINKCQHKRIEVGHIQNGHHSLHLIKILVGIFQHYIPITNMFTSTWDQSELLYCFFPVCLSDFELGNLWPTTRTMHNGIRACANIGPIYRQNQTSFGNREVCVTFL